MGSQARIFTGYDEGWLKINHERFEHGLLLHRGQTTSPWGPASIDALSIEDLQPLLDDAPEVLLIGTGRVTVFPDMQIISWLREQHIGVECMDTRSAARTFNILLAEGRAVSAAMLLPRVG